MNNEYTTINVSGEEGAKTPSLLEKRLMIQLKNKRIRENYKGVSINLLKNECKGKDVYVLGSGPSLNHIPPSFFNNKTIIGVNLVHRKFPINCRYILRIHAKMHDENYEQMKSYGSKLIMSKYKVAASRELNTHSQQFYFFNHIDDNRIKSKNDDYSIDLSMIDSEDSLVTGASVMLSAIHFAYYLGAKNIILCGHDCGSIDENTHLKGYYSEKRDSDNFGECSNLWEKQSIELINTIREKGVNVCSINPFINFNLEGHKYKGVI